jgi:hypothetical protein
VLRAIGVGGIKIKTQDGVNQVLWGVRHMLGLRRNLVFLGALHFDGMLFCIELDEVNMKIMKRNEGVVIGKGMTSILAARVHSCKRTHHVRWS